MIVMIDGMEKYLSRRKIDYLSVVVPLTYFEEKEFSNSLKSFFKGKSFEWVICKEQFKQGLIYKQKNEGWWIKLQHNHYKQNVNKVRISFNYYSFVGLKLIAQIIEKILPGGWGFFLKAGHITRVDFAFDFLGVKPSDFLWGVSYNYKKCQQFINDNTGELESVYLGAKSSKKCVLIYDRKASKKVPAKAEEDLCSLPPGFQVTRVEVRIKPDSVVYLEDLSDLTQYLNSVHVLKASSANAIVASQLSLLMKVGSQRYVLRNEKAATGFISSKICQMLRSSMKSNPVSKLSNGFEQEIHQLLFDEKLVA